MHQLQLDALLRLQADHQRVGLGRGAAAGEDRVRHRAELQVDLGAAARHALAGAQVEGHARPAPVVDVGAQGDEGLGAAGTAQFVEVARDGTTIDRAGGVLPGDGLGRNIGTSDRTQRAQHLDLLVAHRGGLELRGRLHRGEAQQLQQVVLQHVADGTGAVVVVAAAFHADGLGDGDLHLLDVARVPQRFEQRIAEAQGEQVLHAVLAQVVIDAIDALLVEAGGDAVVDGDGLVQVVADGLLEHDAGAGPGQAVCGEGSTGADVERGRGGEVVEHVAAAQRRHARGERGHGRIVVERRGLVVHAIEQRSDGRIVQE